jgi:hypothetical protein
MSFLDVAINAADLPVSENSFDPLPAGWYQVNIKGAELKDTKAGTGQYIAVQYDVLGPTHQGRVVFGNLNIRNPNPKAEEIGRQQLGELMRAIGLATVQDTDQLIGGQLSIKLKIRKSEEYGDSNDVSGYKALDGGIAQSPAPAQASPQVATASAAPWAK